MARKKKRKTLDELVAERQARRRDAIARTHAITTEEAVVVEWLFGDPVTTDDDGNAHQGIRDRFDHKLEGVDDDALAMARAAIGGIVEALITNDRATLERTQKYLLALDAGGDSDTARVLRAFDLTAAAIRAHHEGHDAIPIGPPPQPAPPGPVSDADGDLEVWSEGPRESNGLIWDTETLRHDDDRPAASTIAFMLCGELRLLEHAFGALALADVEKRLATSIPEDDENYLGAKKGGRNRRGPRNALAAWIAETGAFGCRNQRAAERKIDKARDRRAQRARRAKLRAED